MNSIDEEFLDAIDKTRDTLQNIVDWLNGTRETQVSFVDIEQEVRETHSQLLGNRARWLERKQQESDRPLSATLALLVQENGLPAFVRALADCCENPNLALGSPQQLPQVHSSAPTDTGEQGEESHVIDELTD